MRAWMLVAVAAMVGCGGGEGGLGLGGSGGAGGGVGCPEPTACADAVCPSGMGVPIYSCDPSCGNSGPDYCEHACSAPWQIELPKTATDASSSLLHVEAMSEPIRECAACGNGCGTLWWSTRVHIPGGDWCFAATGPESGLTARIDDGDQCRAEPSETGRIAFAGHGEATVIVGLSGPRASSWINVGFRYGASNCENIAPSAGCNGAGG